MTSDKAVRRVLRRLVRCSGAFPASYQLLWSAMMVLVQLVRAAISDPASWLDVAGRLLAITGSLASIVAVFLALLIVKIQKSDLGESLRTQTQRITDISRDLRLELEPLRVPEGIEEIQKALQSGNVKGFYYVSTGSAVPGFWLDGAILDRVLGALRNQHGTQKYFIGPSEDAFERYVAECSPLIAKSPVPPELAKNLAVIAWRHCCRNEGSVLAARIGEQIKQDYEKARGRLQDLRCGIYECLTGRVANVVLLVLDSARDENYSHYELLLFGERHYAYQVPVVTAAGGKTGSDHWLLTEPIVYRSKHPFLGRAIYDQIETILSLCAEGSAGSYRRPTSDS